MLMTEVCPGSQALTLLYAKAHSVAGTKHRPRWPVSLTMCKTHSTHHGYFYLHTRCTFNSSAASSSDRDAKFLDHLNLAAEKPILSCVCVCDFMSSWDPLKI